MHQSWQKEKHFVQPREKFELSTPGLQDQCSNHWANEADKLVLKIAKTKKERRKRKTTVNRGNLIEEINQLLAKNIYERTNWLKNIPIYRWINKSKYHLCIDHDEKKNNVFSPVRDLNSPPLVYKTSALANELTRLTRSRYSFTFDHMKLFSHVCAVKLKERHF